MSNLPFMAPHSFRQIILSLFKLPCQLGATELLTYEIMKQQSTN